MNSLKPIAGFSHLTDLPCYQLTCGDSSAVISLYGAQLLSYQPSAGDEQLWLSELAGWHNQQAIRGGVPICWPWFGPPDSRLNPEKLPLPNHGLVRNRLWQLLSTDVTPESVSISLYIDIDDVPHLLCPGTVRLQLTLQLTQAQLKLSLNCDNDLLQQAALHSYFTVSDIRHARVSPLPKHYYDKVSDTEQCNDSKTLSITEETDRVYHQPAKCLQLDCLAQQVIITHSGHDSAVLWNPWQQKSRALPDMTELGFQNFVCIESARLKLERSAPLKLELCITKV